MISNIKFVTLKGLENTYFYYFNLNSAKDDQNFNIKTPQKFEFCTNNRFKKVFYII